MGTNYRDTSPDGFDERFSTAWREDRDLFFTLLEHSETEQDSSLSVYAPEAVAIHPIRAATRGISLFQRRKSLFNALLYKKYPQLYRQRIPNTPPWHYYGIVGSLLGMLLGLLNNRIRLILSATGLWVSMTGRFCIQRLHQTSHVPDLVVEVIITSALIPPLAIFWRICGAFKFRVFFL
ncbi:MAG TPA: hypothetical protein VNM22_06175 [Candidatus Limnocylindrales bacterium]|nr:hypothetical protein [Candidatus Limnocylindrales bacterium]